MSIRFCCGISSFEFIVLGLEEQAITAQQLKNHRFAWRVHPWPLSGKYYSLPFLPATPSSLSGTLEGLFEHTFGTLQGPFDSPRTLLPELQRYKDNVRCVALGAEVPGHHKCTSFSAPKIGRARTLWRV